MKCSDCNQPKEWPADWPHDITRHYGWLMRAVSKTAYHNLTYHPEVHPGGLGDINHRYRPAFLELEDRRARKAA